MPSVRVKIMFMQLQRIHGNIFTLKSSCVSTRGIPPTRCKYARGREYPCSRSGLGEGEGVPQVQLWAVEGTPIPGLDKGVPLSQTWPKG